MSSLFNHIFIPLVMLLLFSKKLGINYKKVLALSLFSILPDLDAVFLDHRATFHNILVLAIPLMFFILLKSRRDIFGMIGFFLASHILLDLFNGGVFLLYPFYNKVLFIHAELRFDQYSFIPILEYGIRGTIMNMDKGEPVISSENIGVIVLLALIAVFAIQNRKEGDNED